MSNAAMIKDDYVSILRLAISLIHSFFAQVFTKEAVTVQKGEEKKYVWEKVRKY